MKGIQPVPRGMIDDAQKLYLKYAGRQHERIDREMRAKGWRFYRSLLYTTRHKWGLSPGWIERFGWIKKLTAAQRSRLLHRNFGSNRFESWLVATFPEWMWKWKYQRYIYKKLASLTATGNGRLMIFMPPRHGKSEMVTVRYTAWRLLQDPKLNVIVGSYNQKLADKFSRKIKRICGKSDAFTHSIGAGTAHLNGTESGKIIENLTPKGVTLTKLLNTASEWETHGGGVVRSVGVGAGIAGFGAGLIVIDDPVRNRADAESETYRDRVFDWFNDDIYTRMEPNASIILIQTRWHEDDLAGRLLKEMENGGERWDVVCLPALAEERVAEEGVAEEGEKGRKGEGETARSKSPLLPISSSPLLDPLGRKEGHALCPKRYSAATLLRYKKKLGSYSFSALYQQRPVPLEGGRFKRAWFKNIVDQAPDKLRWKRGYDLAVSTKTSADYTASFRCAYDRTGNLYIADGFRKRIEYPEQRRYIIARMKAETDTEHGIEAAMHGKAVVQELRREREIRRFAFREVRVTGDKLTRALA